MQRIGTRRFSSSRIVSEFRYNFNSKPDALAFLDDDSIPSHQRYRRVKASELHSRTEPPKRVKMLARDFIDDSLYNRNYGYFSKQAVIFSPDAQFEISSMRDNMEFMSKLADHYDAYEKQFSTDDVVKQVWHTPTEIFKPWYGYAIAKYLVEEHKKQGGDLVIYEIGAGNGTLMNNILDYIKQNEMTIYEKTRYRIIEISTQLAERQKTIVGLKHPRVEIVNQSIFDWNTTNSEPCFLLAMEVMDNLSHDMVRYDIHTLEPYHCVVCVDAQGSFFELYEPITDPLTKEFLEMRKQLNHKSPILSSPAILRRLRSMLPFAPNFTKGEFLPTKLYALIKTLHKHLPNHRLVTSDFYTLPDVIGEGKEYYTAPVVQTRYENTMVACSTYLVQQGWFDIFFPTDFDLLSDMYSHITSRNGRIHSHREFLEANSPSLKETTTKSGENPMLMYYENVKFFTS